MRLITAGDEAKLRSPLWRVRVLVADATGTFRDLTTLGGGLFNAVKSVRWGEDVDAPGLTADIELFRNLDAISLSPLHDTSPLNRATPFDAASALGALVDLNRKVRIEWALSSDEGEAPTWVQAFEGLVETFSLDGEESMKVGCRGQYAELQDRVYEEEFVFAFASSLAFGGFRIWQPNTVYLTGQYVIPTTAKSTNARWYTVSTGGTSGATEPTWPTSGTVSSGSAVFTHQGTTSPTAGYAVEAVLEAMARHVIADGSALFGDPPVDATSIRVYTPTSPGWAINVFQVKRESIWNAMQALAQQIGWDLRWKWDDAEACFRLTLYDPQRTKTTPDRTVALQDVSAYEDVALDIANIRNVVRVVYSDASDVEPGGTPRRKTATAIDAGSVTRFGRRYMEVAEGSSSAIDSPGEAADFAGRMLSDLATPVAEVGVQLRFFPYVELTDLLRLPPDGRRFTAAQDLAVTSYQHSWAEGVGETTVQVRGKPSSGWYRWARIATAINPEDTHRLVDSSLAAGLTVGTDGQFRGQLLKPGGTRSLGALEQQWQVHVSPTAGFTPSASTLKGQGTQPFVAGIPPGQVQYAKLIPLVWNAQRLVAGQPTEDIPVTAPYVEPLDLDPEKFRAEAPLNGSFESSFDAFDTPPAHWSLLAGTWKVDVTLASSDSYEGARAVQWGTTSGTFGLRSAWFPVREGENFTAQFALKRVSGDGDVRFTVEWGDRAKASLGTATFDTNTTGYSAWGLSKPTSFTAPAGAAYARVSLARAATGTFSFRVDAVAFRAHGEAWRGATAESWWASSDWEDFGGGYQAVQARRDASGRVFMRGLARALSSPSGGTILNLPAGLRPPAIEVVTVLFGFPPKAAQVDINPGGAVVLVDPAANLNEYVSFSGITFDTR